MKEIGLFYAPALGSTEKVAKKIVAEIGEEHVDLILIDDTTKLEDIEKYNKLILGISTVGRDTWDANYKKVGWDIFLPQIGDANLKEKTVAIFGLGDHLIYADFFVDAMGELGQKVIEAGANIIGQCSPDNYTFNESKAIIDGKFIGLPIDQDNEEDLTEQRIKDWVKEIKSKLI